VKLTAKPGYELMLSNANYESQNKTLVFCGNYISTLSAKELKKSSTEPGMFFIGKIDADGKCVSKEIVVEADKPKIGSVAYPVFCAGQLSIDKNGECVAAGEFGYYGLSQQEGVQFLYVPCGLTYMVFNADLNVSVQETNVFTRLTVMPSDMNNVELFVLGAKMIRGLTRSDSYYDAETGEMLVTFCDDSYQNEKDNHAYIYAMKIVAGKKEYFKDVADIVKAKNTFVGLYIMNSRALVYYSANQSGKTEFTNLTL
jgi:hypothetical protein